ncbi:hypothetical protein Taro_037876, partial [Colocasia esculenta]|nr:hypothetical protein [Colocasia esculenta]
MVTYRVVVTRRSSTGPREGPEEEEEAPTEDAGGASSIGEGEGIVVEEISNIDFFIATELCLHKGKPLLLLRSEKLGAVATQTAGDD